MSSETQNQEEEYFNIINGKKYKVRNYYKKVPPEQQKKRGPKKKTGRLINEELLNLNEDQLITVLQLIRMFKERKGWI